MSVILIQRIFFFIIVSFYSQILFASNSYFIYSAVKVDVVNPNSLNHEIKVSFRVAAIGDLSQNKRFGIKYKKYSDPDKAEYWHIANVFSELYQFSNLVQKDIVINGVSVIGNSGEYDFMICHVASNQLYKLGSIHGYQSIQKVNITFFNTQTEIENLLGQITSSLKILETVSKGYGILFTQYDEDIRKEIKKTGNVIDWIGKANDIVSWLNWYKTFINETDPTKQYLKIMEGLIKTDVMPLPAPLANVFSLYIKVAISFKDAINRLSNNIGAAEFSIIPDECYIKLKARKLNYSFWPDPYFNTEKIENFTAKYYLDGYPLGGTNPTSVELGSDKYHPSNDGYSVIIPLKGKLDNILNKEDSRTKYSLRIEFKNVLSDAIPGQSVAIPLDKEFASFKGVKSIGEIMVGIDIRLKDSNDGYGKQPDITPMKASEF